MMRLVAFALMVLSLLAAPAYACLATPAPDHAWERGNTKDMPYPKGKEGPMAPIMGGKGEGGIPTAWERANEKFPIDECTNTDCTGARKASTAEPALRRTVVQPVPLS
ncbi:MAG TPA: hypothetical protein VGR26_05355 [Acidimicrobiales bacterium]|nr:hypothetical protein [Acidimicrobiales bacterium]